MSIGLASKNVFFYHNRKRITILSQRLGVMKDKL